MTEKRSKAKSASRARMSTKSAARSTPSSITNAKGRQGGNVKRASENAGERIESMRDWRAETLAEVRRLIREAAPDIEEEYKWIKPTNPLGVPVWSHGGIVCTGESYKQVVKLTFAKGAFLEDPRGLFNSSLEGNTRRAIDIRQGEALDAKAFKALIQAAIAENLRSSAPESKSLPTPGAKAMQGMRKAKSNTLQRNEQGVVLLSGGNPQIAKADGDAPVQAYIAAMPGWKRAVGRWLDALIVRHVPQVRKAVRWNSPFYGIEGQGWFLGIHCLTKYVKVTFFQGLSLQPIPPGGTPKSKDSRWIDIYEGDDLDEAQMATWVKQAAALPGWIP